MKATQYFLGLFSPGYNMTSWCPNFRPPWRVRRSNLRMKTSQAGCWSPIVQYKYSIQRDPGRRHCIVQSGPGAIMWCNLPVSPLVSILQLASVHSRSWWCPFSTTCTASRTPLPQQLSPHSISHLHVGDPRCGRDGRAHTYTNTSLTL